LGPRGVGLNMSLPIGWEALQQYTKGAPLIECILAHLNVPKKWRNKVLGTNCEDQKNQHLQLATSTT